MMALVPYSVPRQRAAVAMWVDSGSHECSIALAVAARAGVTWPQAQHRAALGQRCCVGTVWQRWPLAVAQTASERRGFAILPSPKHRLSAGLAWAAIEALESTSQRFIGNTAYNAIIWCLRLDWAEQLQLVTRCLIMHCSMKRAPVRGGACLGTEGNICKVDNVG